MKVNVLFFGAVADVVGSRRLELSVEGAIKAKSIVERLARDHSVLANRQLLIAVNQEHADSETVLKDGDEVAFFTAVSGG